VPHGARSLAGPRPRRITSRIARVSRLPAGVDILHPVISFADTAPPRPLPELWRFRGLIGLLVWRDLKVRYKRSVLGMLWTLLNPLLQMAVYTVVFSMVLRVGLPGFPVFLLAGLLPWTLVSVSATSASAALLGNQALIRKVAVPQAVYPLALVGSKLVDVVLSLGPLAVVAALLGRPPGPSFLLLLPAMAVAASFAAGLALLSASLTVFFRDMRHLLDVLFQLWFYATPILYPADAAGALGRPWLRTALALNPMTPIVRLFQACAYEGRPPAGETVAAAAAIALATLVAGWVVFRRLEPRHVHWL